ncbi:MAG TPA: glycogen debranching N-terminal domain-containing protein [Woeseiaceae bacterium]|nr:glycogen debranching N-terminal domain-containing protein [Woeseiaceae bacterium]
MEPATRPASDGVVLKRNDAFAILDEYADIRSDLFPDQGLYLNDCRHLSRLQLRLGTVPPLLLASNLGHDGAVLSVDLTNSDVFGIGDQAPPARETVHVLRQVFLWDDVLYQRLRFRSYAGERRLLIVQTVFDADFLDMFEIRGTPRNARGEIENGVTDDHTVRLRYRGLDEVVRDTNLCFHPRPVNLAPTAATHRIDLEPRGEQVMHLLVSARQSGAGYERRSTQPLVRSYRVMRRHQETVRAESPTVRSSNELFNEWINRSVSDLHMLLADRDGGIYPHAGTPWFNAEFGRDGLLTAYQSLAFEPRIAAGVLRFLARFQAAKVDEFRDAQPGKILHERRQGEMARLGEVPFAAYYGSADATPLFVMLAGAYLARTGDTALLAEIGPALSKALQWMREYGDADGDGYLEYVRASETGLRNQGWKDSDDAVSHGDGTLALGAIALCEVQAYAYGAHRAAADIARAMGDSDLAAGCEETARSLAAAFDRDYWDEELGTYVLALDGEKAPCRVRSSNAGHALLAGIARPERAAVLARSLTSADMYSGWGIRTLSVAEVRHSPLSYHNGSVWPHDNALIAMGLARYGYRKEPLRVMSGLFDASLYLTGSRLPELFCGFARKRGGGPVEYAEACAPQAWSSAALYACLAATLGITFDAPRRQIRIEHPALPEYLHWVEIHDLPLGERRISLRFERNTAGMTSAVPISSTRDVELVIRR